MKIASSLSAGDLVTNLSADEAGHDHLTVMRDLRRELDRIVRREGDKLLQPKTGDAGTQATPNFPDTDEKITLIFSATQDNGREALIVGTPTTLYRFYGFDDNLLYEAGVYEAGVHATISDGTWLVIGSGFTTENAHRWEAKNVGGYAIFNNGIDLPVSYHLNEFSVRPIHELREQGISFVGTIEEISGILVCADIGDIVDTYLRTVMDAVGYGGFANGQMQHINRIHYNVIFTDPLSPLRWGASVPGTIVKGSRVLDLAFNAASLAAGDSIRVVGAGLNGGDLLTTLGYKAGAKRWILADLAEESVEDADVAKADAAGLAIGQFPLKDDVSAVLRCIKVQDRLILAKADGFIIAEYSGNASAPFFFQRVYSGEEGLHWRWTIREVNGELIYAGATEFYSFDLVSRRPKQHPRLSLCSNIFFTGVAAAAQDDVFAIDNGTTREVWFIFPSATADKGLAYCYAPRALGGDRCSTIGEAYSAGATISRPGAEIVHSVSERWFVLGLPNGTLVQYLKDRTGSLGWRRRGVDYNSDLWSGLADFGDEYHEKTIRSHLLLLASMSPNTSVAVEVWGGDNANSDLALLPDGAVTLATPKTKNLIKASWVEHLVQDRIRVTGTGNICIRKRQWDVGLHGGGGVTRA